jgi:DNA-binding NarL/FixJ family response regulator
VLEGYLRSGEDSATQAAVALSPRERNIVQLLAEGNNNKEVARALQLSVKTVETHRSNIMRKLSFHSIRDLVVYAIKNNLIQIELPPSPPKSPTGPGPTAA